MSDVVDVGRGTIRYKLRGDGPPLVLVSTVSGIWLRQVSTLKKHFTVLTYDMRGFGESRSTSGLPSNEDHADDLAALLDALSIPRATVVGLSHGGLVTQHFALRHGELLAGLGLVATFAKARNSTQLFLRMLYGFLERDDVSNFWEVLKSFLFSASNSEALLRRESALRAAMFDVYTAATLRNIYAGAIEHDSVGAGLGDVRCPTLVVGGQEDMLFPAPLAKELSDLIPGSRLVMLPAAHVPPVEVPREFNGLLVEFFGRDS